MNPGENAPVATKIRHAPTLLSIDAGHEGQRIDNFLFTALKGVPRSLIYRLLREGQVRVNKGRIKPVYRLRSGDVVRIPPLRRGESETPPPTNAARERLAAAILYEDDDLLAIDKPAGFAVHGGSGVANGVIEVARALYPDCPEIALVHRLDRATSGCLLLAKRRTVLLELQELFKKGGVEKHYLALVQGAWKGGDRTVRAALEKNRLQSGERMVRVAEVGKAADTRFRPVERFGAASLMEIRLGTGRMHQIRVHATHIGHPIAGDEKYGDAAFNRVVRGYGLRRLFLHASRLSWQRPGKAPQSVEAPLPAELEAVLERLRGLGGGAR